MQQNGDELDLALGGDLQLPLGIVVIIYPRTFSKVSLHIGVEIVVSVSA